MFMFTLYCICVLLYQSVNGFSPSSNVWSPQKRVSVSPSSVERRTNFNRIPPGVLFASSESSEDSQSQSLTSQVAPTLEKIKGGSLLLPLAEALEDSTDGWALSYADLSPETETTPVGVGFLATNIAYTLCGLLLVQSGNVLLGVLTELASVASFAYHFTQLKLGKNQPLVRVALLVDYVVATATLLAALVYILQVGVDKVPFEGIVASVLAVVFLFLSWVWEEGLPYVINHGLWHLLGAYAGFMIGTQQIQSHL